MAKITYTNKVALNENPEIALINKVTDDDLNEIKSVVNTNDDNVGDLTNLTTTTKTNIVASINEVNSDKAADDIILVQSTEPSSETNILWINDGQIGTPASEITNSYSTSTGIGYSANYVNNLMIPQSYNLTNLPTQSGGTNVYQLNKINNLVVLNIDVIWFNSITLNTWLDLGQIPAELYPSKEITSNCAIVNGGNGNVIGNGRIIVTTAGLIRVKSIISNNDLTGCGCSISWIIN